MSRGESGTARQAMLPDDFARRVTQKVEQIKRRRLIRRRLLAVMGVLAVVAGSAFLWRQATVADLQPIAVLDPPSPSGWPASPAIPDALGHLRQDQGLVGFFFPDADPLNDFNQSYGEAGWHSYDSWWTSSS